MLDKLKSLPLVSVIIPVYNNKDWLKEAVESVLKQTYLNYEILIIDDGSTEDIRDEYLNNNCIHYYRNSNHGVAYSRNYGIEKAKGKYVAFLDSDDFWCPQKIERQVELMETNKSVWSQHNYYYFDDKKKKNIGIINTYKYKGNIKRHLFLSFKVQTSCFMILREALIKDGIMFENGKSFGEEWILYNSLAQKYELLCINEELGYFRIRGTNAGLNAKIQMDGRANLWNDMRNTDCYKNNTDLLTKFSYWLCFKGKIITDRYNSEGSDLLCKVMYGFPWLLFRIKSLSLVLRDCRGN